MGHALGQGGGINVFSYYCLCAHSSPLGKEVKQERNLREKQKTKTKNNEKERGGESGE